MRYYVNIDGHEHAIEVSALPGGDYDVRVVNGNGSDHPNAGTAVHAELIASDGPLTIRINGRVFDLVVHGDLPKLDVFASGRRAPVHVETARMRAAASVRSKDGGGDKGTVESPMPGKVVKVLVSEGDSVSSGTPLVVVEAMKMENELVAERDGTIKKVFVKPGDAVEGGARLITIV